eukprot:3779092-Ditylum_brightwellii.AAC.1
MTSPKTWLTLIGTDDIKNITVVIAEEELEAIVYTSTMDVNDENESESEDVIVILRKDTYISIL